MKVTRKTVLATLLGGVMIVAGAGVAAAGMAVPAALWTPKNDPTAGTWLPVGGSAGDGADSTRGTMAVDAFLRPLSGALRPLVCQYNGSALAASRAFVDGKARAGGANWSCVIHTGQVADDPSAMDLTATFKLKAGRAAQAGVALAFDFGRWSASNFVLIPASVYNGNRHEIIHNAYAQGLPRSDWHKKDLPQITRPLPHLGLHPGDPSKIEVLSNNASTPSICFFDRRTGRAFILLAEQAGRTGNGNWVRNAHGNICDNGFSVQESPDRHHATLVVSSPGVRDRKPLFIGFTKSPDRGIDLKAGDVIRLHLRIYAFMAKNIPGLYAKFMQVRKAVTGPTHPRNLYPMSEVATLMAHRIDTRFYKGKFDYYTCENATWISFGWVGGLMNTFPMLVLDDAKHLKRVSETFNFAIPRAQGRAGYFYGALDQTGRCFGREGYPDPRIVLTRKNGDVLYWMIRQFMLLKAQGRGAAIKPAWTRNIKRLADAFVRTWKEDGQWGNDLNVDTGQVVIYNSTSGASAIGGMALASRYYHDREYLKITEEAANYYYQHYFVKRGMTTGNSADTLANADGDSPAALMTSLMVLYDTTGNRVWLNRSRNVANLFSSWVLSYDYVLPANTALGRRGAKLAGVVWASTQNKHAAPGICTSSGQALFRIYRDTGDKRYAQLIRGIFHAYTEGIKPRGKITERLSYCDAPGSFRGELIPGSTGWCELNGALMAMELPGVYVRTDKNEMYVFDSVKVRVVRRDAAGVTLEITNPAKYPAAVKILAENAARARRPLGYEAFLKWPRAKVPAGGTVTVTIGPTGRIR